MKLFIASVAALLFAGTGCKPKEQAPAEETESIAGQKFEFTVLKTAGDLSFKPVKGVEWKALSYSCKQLPCEFTLSEAGVNSKTPAALFNINFKVSEKEVEMLPTNADKLGNPEWQNQKYSCTAKECAFSVSEKGVSGI